MRGWREADHPGGNQFAQTTSDEGSIYYASASSNAVHGMRSTRSAERGVLSLAKCMWRKSRLIIYAQLAAARTKVNDVDPLQSALDAYEAARKAAWDSDAPLREPQKALTPPEKHSLPAEERREHDLTQEDTLEQHLAKLGEQITPEKLIEEIELAGRLDARIDRLLKRLFQPKAAKQMLGLGSRPQDGSSPIRKLSSSPASRANGGGQVAADKAYAAGKSRTAS